MIRHCTLSYRSLRLFGALAMLAPALLQTAIAQAVNDIVAPPQPDNYIVSFPPNSTAAARAERLEQQVLWNDLFGRPPDLSSAHQPPWLRRHRDTLVHEAQRIYQERDFNSLPNLAKVLESAGCDHSAILYHCREQTSHARGCWIIDLLLDKELRCHATARFDTGRTSSATYKEPTSAAPIASIPLSEQRSTHSAPR